MKKNLVIICMASLVMVACSKKNPAPNVDNTNADSITADTIVPDTAVCEFITNAVKDYDGNTYNAVKIGEQVWMAENLRTKKVFTLYDPEWARIAPDFNESNVAKYGYLYRWEVLMGRRFPSSANPSGVQGICPNGWHVPSDSEWTQLADYISKHNVTGFSVPYAGHIGPGPGGDRSYDFGTSAYLWSSTNDDGGSIDAIWGREITIHDSVVEMKKIYCPNFENCYSVRCVKD